MSNPSDRQILNSVVNPLLPLGEGVYDDENEIPPNLVDSDPLEASEEQIEESRRFEKLAIEKCEEGNFKLAKEMFKKAEEACTPARPSVFNNRYIYSTGCLKYTFCKSYNVPHN